MSLKLCETRVKSALSRLTDPIGSNFRHYLGIRTRTVAYQEGKEITFSVAKINRFINDDENGPHNGPNNGTHLGEIAGQSLTSILI